MELGLRDLRAARKKLGLPQLALRPARAASLSTAALRVRRHRARRAAGRLSLSIEVDEVALIKVLVQADLLDRLQDHDRAALGHAIEHLIELLEVGGASGREAGVVAWGRA